MPSASLPSASSSWTYLMRSCGEDHAPPAGRQVRHDRVVQGPHARHTRLAVDVVGMRARVIAAKRARIIERRLVHAERIEDHALHRGVVRGTQLHVRVHDMAADVTGRGRHQVVVLEHLAELAGRLGRGELVERRRRRRGARRVEDPVEILARQTGAGADEVLHQHLARRLGAAEAECGIDLRHLLVPGELALIHQPRQQKRGHALGVRRDHEHRMRIDGLRLAQLTHADAALVHDLAVFDDRGHSAPGDSLELLHPGLQERFQRFDPRGIEGMRGLAGEHLARVTGAECFAIIRPKLPAPRFSTSRLPCRRRCPRPSISIRLRDRDALNRDFFVRRGFVIDDLPLVPAVAPGTRGDGLHFAMRIGAVHRPGLRHRIGGIFRLRDIGQDEERVVL